MSSVRPPASETAAQNDALHALIGKFMYDKNFADNLVANNRDPVLLRTWLLGQGHDIDANAISYLVGKSAARIVADTGLNLGGTLPNGTY